MLEHATRISTETVYSETIAIKVKRGTVATKRKMPEGDGLFSEGGGLSGPQIFMCFPILACRTPPFQNSQSIRITRQPLATLAACRATARSSTAAHPGRCDAASPFPGAGVAFHLPPHSLLLSPSNRDPFVVKTHAPFLQEMNDTAESDCGIGAFLLLPVRNPLVGGWVVAAREHVHEALLCSAQRTTGNPRTTLMRGAAI